MTETDNELYYSRQITSLNMDKQKYINFKNSLVNSLIPSLMKPCDDLELAIKGMPNSFTIDGLGIDKSSIENNKTKLEDIISKINGTVIPEIDSKISSIDGSINYYSYLLRKEREDKKSE